MDWTNIILAASNGIAFLLGRKTSKRKTNAEVEKAEADAKLSNAEVTGRELQNMEAVLKLWREMSSDLSHQVEDLRSQVMTFRLENKQLKDEVGQLHSQNADLKKEIHTLTELLQKQAESFRQAKHL